MLIIGMHFIFDSLIEHKLYEDMEQALQRFELSTLSHKEISFLKHIFHLIHASLEPLTLQKSIGINTEEYPWYTQRAELRDGRDGGVRPGEGVV